MTPIVALAVLAALAVPPAAAQTYPPYPADEPGTAGRVQEDIPQDEQEAELREPEPGRRGQIETLRSDKMSSPNVRGETVPEDPESGVPRPRADPRRLESVPKP